MVKVQIDLPDELDKKIRQYQIKKDIRYKADAILQLLGECLNEK